MKEKEAYGLWLILAQEVLLICVYKGTNNLGVLRATEPNFKLCL